MFKFMPYIFSNVMRNKVRTVLTLIGMMIAVSIFCFLASVEATVYRTIDETAQNTMLVMSEKNQW